MIIKKITTIMVEKYKMENYDWMHYKISSKNPFSYHHLLLPKCEKKGKLTIENGAILCQKTSHPYIHIIEEYDQDKYKDLTKILVEVNLQGFLTTIEQYKQINEILKEFEKEYSSISDINGKPLIKESYVIRGIR